jgi:hypothetical protein
MIHSVPGGAGDRGRVVKPHIAPSSSRLGTGGDARPLLRAPVEPVS